VGGGFGGGGSPMDNYDLRADWGRNNSRHRIFTGVNYRMPWGIFANSSINANSGQPYSITTGRDDNFDTTTNDRPKGVARNSAVGPSSWNVNLNFSKTFDLIREESPNQGGPAAGGPNPNQYMNEYAQRGGGGFGGGDQRGPGGPGMGRGGPGGPGGRGGPGGPGGRGGFGQQRSRLQMQLNANIQNLFNHRNFQNPSGVLTSPFFGRSTRANNPREISMGLRFNF
jgi:hypothetical protein